MDMKKLKKRSSRSKRGYQRVAKDDSDDEVKYMRPEDVPVPKELDDFDPHLARRLRRRDDVKWVRSKIEAVVWLGGTAALLRYLDFIHVVLYSNRVDRLWFNMGCLAFIANFFVFLYLAVWLPYMEGIDDDWEDHCPRVIPTATLIGIFSTLCFTIGLWPLYHLLTPVILFVMLMGTIMSAHFLPAF